MVNAKHARVSPPHSGAIRAPGAGICLATLGCSLLSRHLRGLQECDGRRFESSMPHHPVTLFLSFSCTSTGKARIPGLLRGFVANPGRETSLFGANWAQGAVRLCRAVLVSTFLRPPVPSFSPRGAYLHNADPVAFTISDCPVAHAGESPGADADLTRRAAGGLRRLRWLAVSSTGCRPERIASMISGARKARGITRLISPSSTCSSWAREITEDFLARQPIQPVVSLSDCFDDFGSIFDGCSCPAMTSRVSTPRR